MFSTTKKQIWFGELRTSRGNTVVIHDNQLPEASPGRVYLYNTQRNAIVEYVAEIVRPNLYELDEAQAKAVEAEFGSAWKATRAAFLGKRMKIEDLDKPAPAPKKAKTEDDDSFDNDYDKDNSYDNDDWDDDGYDDE